MPARWSAERVLALAPDDSSARAATGLARPAPWSGTGAAGDLVWGLCAGSGKTPYQAIADLAGPAYRCSCPSRKFPCKHALGLLLLWSEGAVPDASEPAGYALAWMQSRRERAEKSLSRTSGGDSPPAAGSGAGEDGAGATSGGAASGGAGSGGAVGGGAVGGGAGRDGAGSGGAVGGGAGRDGAGSGGAGRDGAGSGGAGSGRAGSGRAGSGRAGSGRAGSGRAGSGGLVKDEAASARRAEERAQRVAGGIAELVEWLRDQVRVGLAASVSGTGRGVSGAGAGRAGAGAGYSGGTGYAVSGAGHLDAIAARMVDAQAPGVASMLRGLSLVPASGDGWPARLLAEYARLHLLARAYERLDTLPPGLAAVVRSRVGYTISRQEVLARPAVTDHWLVLGVRDLVEGTVPGRRVWLVGRDTRRPAMLLTFAGNGYWQDQETAGLRAGTELFADLHYYPGQPPLRALTGERHGAQERGKRPEPDGDIDALLAGWADGLAADPWLTTWPALLTGTPVAPSAEPAPTDPAAAARWYLVDEAGAAVPLAEQESLWRLLAVSGGRPVTVAGEWHGETLLPLTVWHHDEAVPL